MGNKTAIVTGAANGIGSAIAIRLIEDGYFVFVADTDTENGQTFCQGLNQKAEFINCDISDEIDVELLYTKVSEEKGNIDVLVNNAGIIRDNMIWKMPAEDFEKVIKVNLTGTWLMCKKFSSLMREQQSGKIINITSRSWLGNAGQSNYSASKAGIVALTRVLALELGKYNVAVNAIAPGMIDTPMTQSLRPEIREKLINAQPTKTMGKPEDIANAVSFLASDNTSFITGQVIYVDGGKSIGANVF